MWSVSVYHTGLFPGVSRSTSGAIHPSVPGIPDCKEKLLRPSGIFLQSPKSEIRARTFPNTPGPERRMFRGFRSRWTRWRKRLWMFLSKWINDAIKFLCNYDSYTSMSMSVCLRPMLSECRCERPHMVCSSSAIGLRSGKDDGSSTYCSVTAEPLVPH